MNDSGLLFITSCSKANGEFHALNYVNALIYKKLLILKKKHHYNNAFSFASKMN